MRDIDVLFLVEHVDRELDAVTCLVHKLQERFKIMADVRNYYHDFEYSLKRYNPKVVVFPFFYGADHLYPIEYMSRWPTARFVNLAWEQILYKLHQSVKVPRDPVAKNNVFHLCWTTKYRDFVASLGVSQDLLCLTGNPVMKFYDDPYRKYFKTREDLAKTYGIDPVRKWVLFCENYRLHFIPTTISRILVNQQNADPQLLEQARAYCDRSLRQFFAWARELDGENNPLLILRPRPATPHEHMVAFMREAAGACGKSLMIIKTESAREWILAADHVISSHSTTLIEAALADKPIHIFSPEPFPEALEDEWYGFVPTLQDREAFLSAVRRSPMEPTGAPLAAWARTRLLPAGDPFDMIAETIARLHLEAKPHLRPLRPDHEWLWTGRIVIERARKWLQGRRARDRQTDVFGADDVASRLARWRRVLTPSEGLTKIRQHGQPDRRAENLTAST